MQGVDCPDCEDGTPHRHLIESASDDERKAAWLAERRTCITGTDIAAIFGLNSFAGPIDVWLSKKAPVTIEANDAMEFGNRFQRPVLEVYSERVGMPIEFADPWTLHRVPGFPLLGASLDARWITGDRRPVDAKTAGWKSSEWGEAGSDEFPTSYQLQLAVQMMATETQVADLAVCFGGYGGHKFARYTMVADPEVQDAIRDKAADWWQKHIIGDVPPEPDGSENYSEYLKVRFARSTMVTKPVTAEVAEWAASLREATERLKVIEGEKERLQQLLKTYLGEASAIPGICTWKNNKNSLKTDWQAAFGNLRNFVLDPEIQKLSTPLDAISHAVDSNTHDTPGPRVFRLAK
jgi:putative phage-type endonuclease